MSKTYIGERIESINGAYNPYVYISTCRELKPTTFINHKNSSRYIKVYIKYYTSNTRFEILILEGKNIGKAFQDTDIGKDFSGVLKHREHKQKLKIGLHQIKNFLHSKQSQSTEKNYTIVKIDRFHLRKCLYPIS